jgi:hypothetical protein
MLLCAVLPGTGFDARAQLAVPQIRDVTDLTRNAELQRLRDRARAGADALEGETGDLPDADIAAALPETGAAEATVITAQDAVSEVAQAAQQSAQDAGSVAGQAAQSAQQAVAAALRTFAATPGPNDWPVERDVRVLLLDDAEVQAARDLGLEILSIRAMPALGLTMLLFREPDPSRLDDALVQLLGDYPDIVADFNHVYRFSQEAAGTPPSGTHAETGGDAAAGDDTGKGLRIGMIDSAVMQDHAAFRNRDIVRREFIMNEGSQPLGHGSAVASLISAKTAADTVVYAASVFFETPGYAPGATTESLVAALDWLAAEDVDAINMSLSGPPNALLERALRRLAEHGQIVVAAVGNNGPSGEPLFPAAYAGVIAATAVDREQRIFRYANRGQHVDFAALGVDVKVADVSGSWRIESGTSMASPLIAVAVADLRGPQRLSFDQVFSVLADHAQDLGRKGFDRIYGYGLVTKSPVLVSRN